MKPLTHFTKIWRMRNNGSVAWPHGTNLLWIGGDQLSKTLFCDLKVWIDVSDFYSFLICVKY